MKTITITITGGNPASIVITEKKPVDKETKKQAALAYLDALFKPVLGEGNQTCDAK